MTDKSNIAINSSLWGGAFLAGVGEAIVNNWVAFGGLSVALAGLLVNWYYKHQAHKRDMERLAVYRRKYGPEGGEH